jgi:hypothetical protein
MSPFEKLVFVAVTLLLVAAQVILSTEIDDTNGPDSLLTGEVKFAVLPSGVSSLRTEIFCRNIQKTHFSHENGSSVIKGLKGYLGN